MNKYLSYFDDTPIYQSPQYFNKTKDLYDAIETVVKAGVKIHECDIGEHTITIVEHPEMKPNEIKFVDFE